MRFVQPRLASKFALTIALLLVTFFGAASARANNIVYFDDTTPNGLINVLYNGANVATAPSPVTTLSSALESVTIGVFVTGIPNLTAVTTYFNIYEPDGTLGDLITISFAPDPEIFITFQSALAGVPLIPGITGPGSVATDLIEAGGPQTVMSLTTTTGDGFDIQFQSDPTPVPEPSSLLLLGTGLVGVLGLAWRKLLLA